MIGADFSRTCEGCEHVVTEPWAKGQTSYRCFAEGRCKGYTVGIERFLPYVPAWCPKLERKERDEVKPKKKSAFPDWTGPAYMIVSSGGKDGKPPRLQAIPENGTGPSFPACDSGNCRGFPRPVLPAYEPGGRGGRTAGRGPARGVDERP